MQLRHYTITVTPLPLQCSYATCAPIPGPSRVFPNPLRAQKPGTAICRHTRTYIFVARKQIQLSSTLVILSYARNRISYTIFQIVLEPNEWNSVLFGKCGRYNQSDCGFFLTRIKCQCVCLYTQRNIFGILSNQTGIRLYLPFSD